MITKLKRTPAIYLVGFMGSGKSTIGALLAERLGWPFTDLDADIEKSQGALIGDIFDELGEPAFRRMESNALRARVRNIEMGMPMVMALGGGAYVQPENYDMISNCGVTIWLDCPLETVKRRVQENAARPLARDPEQFEKLYQERRTAYSRADCRVPIDCDNPAAAVDAIMKLPIF